MEIVVFVVLNYFKSQVSNHYSVDFLEKRESVLVSKVVIF